MFGINSWYSSDRKGLGGGPWLEFKIFCMCWSEIRVNITGIWHDKQLLALKEQHDAVSDGSAASAKSTTL